MDRPCVRIGGDPVMRQTGADQNIMQHVGIAFCEGLDENGDRHFGGRRAHQEEVERALRPVEAPDDVLGFVHVSAPLAAVMTRLAESLAPVGAEEVLSNADFLGLVDFHQTSSPTGRTSSPLACSASSGRDRKAASDPV